jgi:tetrahydrodipicolinate N-acetyltransferase
MNAQEIIDYIANSEKKTPVKVYVNTTGPVEFGSAHVFGGNNSYTVFGDWRELAPVLEANAEKITDCVVENDRRNSGVPLLDLKELKARIEPGAILREKVTIGEGAVIMMGAILNIGAVVGKGTMIDMGAVLGGRATVGDHCHIGAGAVLAGVVEPASATPVIVEDGVLVGANAVVIEGVHIGKNAVVAAGAVVIEDVPENAVVAGSPARIIKMKDEKTEGKTALVDALRKL